MTLARDGTAIIVLLCLVVGGYGNCVYDIREDDHMPIHTDREPFQLGTLEACQDYLTPGRLGCCSAINDQLTNDNFKQIDGAFGSQAGGCDICAVNLKRFWCEYACSARQHEFMWTATEMKPYPDPQTPGAIIMGQEVNVRVHSDTACAIFESCKRVPFVAAVSAMSSPAGFLNFQGHNALNSANQYISMNFSDSLNDSLAFSDELDDFVYNALQTCDYKVTDMLIHNFTVLLS